MPFTKSFIAINVNVRHFSMEQEPKRIVIFETPTLHGLSSLIFTLLLNKQKYQCYSSSNFKRGKRSRGQKKKKKNMNTPNFNALFAPFSLYSFTQLYPFPLRTVPTFSLQLNANSKRNKTLSVLLSPPLNSQCKKILPDMQKVLIKSLF